MKKNLVLSLLAVAFGQTVIAETQSPQKISVEVTEKGFVPSTIDVKPGTEVILSVTRRTDETCSTDVQVPSIGIKKTQLPLNQTVEIALGKLKKGEVRFGCGMNMMDSGQINVR